MAGDNETSATSKERGGFERVLGVFADVRKGEAESALLLMLTIFLVLMSYYIVKVVREPLIIVGGGADQLGEQAARLFRVGGGFASEIGPGMGLAQHAFFTGAADAVQQRRL